MNKSKEQLAELEELFSTYVDKQEELDLWYQEEVNKINARYEGKDE